MTVGQGWQLGKKDMHDMGESESKQTRKSALTTSSLDIAIDLKKPLAPFTREMPTNFGHRPDGRDPTGAQGQQGTDPFQLGDCRSVTPCV